MFIKIRGYGFFCTNMHVEENYQNFAKLFCIIIIIMKHVF